MEKSSYLRTLELQKASCLYAQAREVLPNKMEWKKVKEKGRGWLDKIKVFSAYKKSYFLPSKDNSPGCCKPPSNHENSSKASILSGTLQFHSLFFHLPPFSLSKPTSRESKHNLSSLEPFDFKPCSSIASYFLFCQITQELDEAFVKLLEIC
ncbi:hypothetical protein L3X38_041784 [Prunus dulcis]|uniref:Uncharacterized protein n=1 Tax=Prunus dulcis TaxID=3755 RepID=A0AAD4UV00_PRUDU|nr:hypothetical protein L3X38_041784 [Prunus dulcis]